jgi:23S rRNA pseudouridine2604 synthase
MTRGRRRITFFTFLICSSQVDAFVYNDVIHQTLSAQTKFRCSTFCAADDDTNASTLPGIRLNKVFKATHSRREADKLISSGRVTVNGQPVSAGQRVIPFEDMIRLDDEPVFGWEAFNALDESRSDDNTVNQSPDTVFEYIKYWKPIGVICTTDRRIPDNIIDSLASDGYQADHRIYPVGRLDQDTSGLILLTSDGRLPNAVLRGEHKQPKTYRVTVHKPITDADIDALRQGVVITTVAQRDGKRPPPLTARTKPCQVQRIHPTSVYMTIIEGRNRQVRKMMGALSYEVTRLERESFAGLTLAPLRGPGDWAKLDQQELTMIQSILKRAGVVS